MVQERSVIACSAASLPQNTAKRIGELITSTYLSGVPSTTHEPFLIKHSMHILEIYRVNTGINRKVISGRKVARLYIDNV